LPPAISPTGLFTGLANTQPIQTHETNKVEGPTFTIFRYDCPMLAGGIGRGKDQTWNKLISLVGELDIAYDRKPHPRLWLAIVHLPSIYAFSENEIGG